MWVRVGRIRTLSFASKSIWLNNLPPLAAYWCILTWVTSKQLQQGGLCAHGIGLRPTPGTVDARLEQCAHPSDCRDILGVSTVAAGLAAWRLDRPHHDIAIVVIAQLERLWYAPGCNNTTGSGPVRGSKQVELSSWGLRLWFRGGLLDGYYGRQWGTHPFGDWHRQNGPMLARWIGFAVDGAVDLVGSWDSDDIQVVMR